MTTPVTAHTPLPWKAGGKFVTGHDGHICSMRPIDTRPATQDSANARYIVTACNAHPKLVAALKEIASLAGGLHPHYGPTAEDRLADIAEIVREVNAID